jgi:cold shock CspA family protein/ribosome-associated translation inhibitor RaiA
MACALSKASSPHSPFLTEVLAMQLPLQVSFRHMEHSEAIEALIRERAAKLDSFSDHIMSCRVVVEPAGKHHQHGNLYEVRIDLTVPGEEIAVTREPSQHTESKDIHVALRDAFDSARRQLEDYVRRRRGSVKTLETAPHARVSKLFPEEGYGFIVTPDGREIYFHRDSVLHEGFNRLEIGTEVMFVEEEGKKGPQASTVKVAGRHHHL